MARKIKEVPKQQLTFNSVDEANVFMTEMVHNALMTRTNLLEKLLDPRRDIDTECGYPDDGSITPTKLYELWRRNPIARRAVNIIANESWKVTPELYENEDNDVETPFEKAFKEVCQKFSGTDYYKDDKNNPIWHIMKEADKLAGIADFGICLMGFNDGKQLSEPLEGFEDDTDGEELITGDPKEDGSVESPKPIGTDEQYYDFTNYNDKAPKTDKLELVYLRPYAQHLVEITRWESRPSSPRFNLPTMYRITLGDPKKSSSGIGENTSTVDVHWTRVIHLAEDTESNAAIGTSRLIPKMNNLVNLHKIYGGSAEGYWQVCLPGVVLESEPGTQIDDEEAVKQNVQNYIHRMQRWMSLAGMTAKTLQGTVTDPTSFIEVQLDAICIDIGVPKRVFVGSERGELASTQDKDAWEERLVERRQNYLTFGVILQFVNRLIKCGILPQPEQLIISWEGSDNLSKLTKAQIATTITDMLVKYISGGVDNLIEPMDFLVDVAGFTQTKAEQYLKNTLKHLKDSIEKEPIVGRLNEDAPPAPAPTPGQDPNNPQPVPPNPQKVPAKGIKVKPVAKKG